MSADQSLRQKIESRIAHYRTAIAELSEILKDHPAPEAAFARAKGTKAAAAPVSSEEPTTGKGRPRKRRKAGWIGANVNKVLAETPGLTIGEIAERITSVTGQPVKASNLNVFLSKSGGKYTKDTSGGPRKTKWSLASGSVATPEAPAAEAAEKPKKGRKKG
jgi:hypothetical protein